jgi:itaconyl-CoA hydratase
MFYEDFEIGQTLELSKGRTMLAEDNVWLSLLTMNTNPIHFDYHYSSKTEFGKPLVDSCITLAILSQDGFMNLGWDEVIMPHPVFDGDTIYSKSEVLEKRESQTHSDRGIVSVKTTGVNQNGVTVMEFKRTFMVYKKPQGCTSQKF